MEAEAQRIDSIAVRMRADGRVKITDVKVSVESQKSENGVNFVTLHVSRKLGGGNVWEELAPYAVIQQTKSGTTLAPGQVFPVDRDAVESGRIPKELRSLKGVTKIDELPAQTTAPKAVVKAASSTGAAAVKNTKAAGRGIGVQAVSATNRIKVRDYAERYALTPNGNYHEYTNDCTNFVSQALKAGGWAEIDGSKSDNSKWWYEGGWPTYASYTWAGAQNFYRFARYESGRTTMWGSPYDLRLGDILQYRLTDSTTMTHSMVTTAYDGRVPLLSYHTNNVRNKPYTAIPSQGKIWYAHKI